MKLDLIRSLFPFPTTPLEFPHETESAYSISWEQIRDEIFRIHPDWLAMLHTIRADSLMSEERFNSLLAQHHVQAELERQQIGTWAYRWRHTKPFWGR